MDISPEYLASNEKIDNLIGRIKFAASRRHALDRSSDQSEYYGFAPIDAGSYDDAFDAGAQVGEIDFARELCDLLGVTYDVPGF